MVQRAAVSRRQCATHLMGLRKTREHLFLGEISLLTHMARPRPSPSKFPLLGAAAEEKSQAWNSPGRKHPALVDTASWLSSGGLKGWTVVAGVDTLCPWPTTMKDCLRVLSGPKPTDSAGRRRGTLGRALWPQEEQSEEAAITRLFHAT